uniref:Uncharacterized protein n=1 Tax=Schizaphis graminum TaxID=13262 RepID=A0A2S2PHX6_SCHGA
MASVCYCFPIASWTFSYSLASASFYDFTPAALPSSLFELAQFCMVPPTPCLPLPPHRVFDAGEVRRLVASMNYGCPLSVLPSHDGIQTPKLGSLEDRQWASYLSRLPTAFSPDRTPVLPALI